MSEKTETSSIDSLAEQMLKRQKENNVQACSLDAPEQCETCSG